MFPKKLLSYTFLGLLAIGTLSSCEKEEDAVVTTPANHVDPVGTLTDGAVLVTARANVPNPVSVPGFPSIDLTVDVPVAIFYQGGKPVPVGGVTIDAKALENNGNVYSLGQSLVSPTGEFYTYDSRSWSVQAGGGVSAFSYVPSRQLPTIATLNTPADVVKGELYTGSVSGVSNADSILYNVGGVTRTVGPQTLSVTFTAEETRDVQGGAQTVIQVAAYNIERRDVGSLPVYHVGEEVKTAYVASN